MNPKPHEIRHSDLVHNWKEYNRIRRANAAHYQLQCKDLTFDEYLVHKDIDYDQHIHEPMDPQELLQRTAKYTNHVRVT